MQTDEILSRFAQHGRVKQVKSNEWYAQCPCGTHNDQNPSVHITQTADGNTLVYCFGCGAMVDQIAPAIGLDPHDFFSTDWKYENPIATYRYPNGNVKYRCHRKSSDDKSFAWKHTDDQGKNIYSKDKNVPPSLFVSGDLNDNTVFLVEGEKDAINVHRYIGFTSVCTEDGATMATNGLGNKWKKEYETQLKGKLVYILPDNDTIGKNFALAEANALMNVAQVKVLDLTRAWPNMQEKEDISDIIAQYGPAETSVQLAKLMDSTPVFTAPVVTADKDPLSCIVSMDTILSSSLEYIIPGCMPKGSIVVVAGDGGVGKSRLMSDVVAKLSSGKKTILDDDSYVSREPQKILILESEDPIDSILKPRLDALGANQSNIYVVDIKDSAGSKLFKDAKLGSPTFNSIIDRVHPNIVYIDPLESFLPIEVNMGARNQIRDCLDSLLHYCEAYSMVFIIVVHSNKRDDAWGRNRIADSAGIWDTARSVLIAGSTTGNTSDNGYYLSHEKCNWDEPMQTILYHFNADGLPIKDGYSDLKDKDYVQANSRFYHSNANKDSIIDKCKASILHILSKAKDKTLETSNIPTVLSEELNESYSRNVLIEAKRQLTEERKIKRSRDMGTGDHSWFLTLSDDD